MSLESIADRYWNTLAEFSPTVATVRGIHEFDDQLRHFDDGWLDGMAGRFRGLAAEAAEIDQDGLGIQGQISIGLLIHECQTWATDLDHRFLVGAVDPYIGPHNRLLSDSRQNTVANTEQAEALLRRYAKAGDYLAEALDFQRRNSSAGMTPASASVTRVLSQLEGYLALSLDDDPFLQLQVPTGQDAWLQKATDLVSSVIRPAFEDYRAGLIEHVVPLARPDDKCGLVWMTNGEVIYQSLIRKYTQLGKTAQEIHEIGQYWVTEVNGSEWAEIGGPALGEFSRESLFKRLHSDPSMRFGSEDEMLEHARSAVDRAWSKVDDWFDIRPDTQCKVVPVPKASAPAMPPAYYMQPPVDGSRPGTYFLNTYKPEERDRFEYESIHFHEAIPGHHFDRSLASELEGIPTFRRYAQVFAHTEGWGLYVERLADEMGLYSSDVDRLGMISADAWRGGRLVVDTGIHALGWSRDQATEYLGEWTPIGRLTIEQEIDRYIGMPGQALSYKMGQLEILRLRKEAETRLGGDFDIKGFHNTMLANGAMPLPMLSRAVDAWIDGIQKADD